MITGVRLTQLELGEPLLGTSWEYKTLTGKEAVEKRLDDIFYNASYMGFNLIIDTIKPEIDINGKLTLSNNGLYGNIWTFEDRMKKYKDSCLGLGLKMFIEIDLPTNITNENYLEYADFILDLISNYDWIKHWQPIIYPERMDKLGQLKCSPTIYKKFMEYIYPKIKKYNSEILVGGPGIFESLLQYVNTRDGWLADAIGENFGKGSAYTEIGDTGFLPYIDFFTFRGWQNTSGLSYTKFPNVMDVLKEGIFKRIGDNNLVYFSTYQGWQANSSNKDALEKQSYYELREILNCIKYNVKPFKCQLMDEYPYSDVYNGKFDATKLDYGLFYWFLGDTAAKPAVDDYMFLLETLSDYTDVYTLDVDNMDANDKLDTVTLIKTDSTGSTLATIIWPKTYNEETVVLKPQYNRQYLLPNGTKATVDTLTQITFSDNKFLVVLETVETISIDVDDLEKIINKKITYAEETLSNLISLLPDSYNKETTDTNFYKLLRSLSLEMADAKVDLDVIKEDLYLDTARGNAIYNNFGVLVHLRKKANWDLEKYRSLVQGVTQSLLAGPTTESITNALQLFTNFTINITELYKNQDKYDDSVLQGVNPQFAFVVEIEKPLDDITSQEDVYTDTNYILNIVKPAHTLSILIVMLTGKENWRDQYLEKHGINFKDMDSQPGAFNRDSSHNVLEGIYGWKHLNYKGQLKTGVNSNANLTNGGMLIGPRYVLHDKTFSDSNLKNYDSPNHPVYEDIISLLDINIKEEYDKAESTLAELGVIERETKFGFDFSHLLMSNGGPDKLRILNKYRLAYASKLKDTYTVEPEYFYKDKYVFRNTLRAVKFSTNYGFGGKFSIIPDQLTVFDFYTEELTFKKKLIKLDDGSNAEIARLSDLLPEIELDLFSIYNVKNEKNLLDFSINYEEDLHEDDSLIPWLRLNGPNFMEKKLALHKFRAKYSAELINNEKYNNVLENNIVYNEDNECEYYRPILLSDEYYHVHKKITKIIGNEQYILAGRTDLFTKGTVDEDSLCKVYINGIIQSSYVYKDIYFNLDLGRTRGVSFYDGIVFPGDTVTLMYLCDKNLIIGDFPIEENYHYDVFGGKFINDKFNLEKLNSSKYMTDLLNKDIVTFKNLDIFKNVDLNSSWTDKMPEVASFPIFEPDCEFDYKDWSRRNKSLYDKFMLNKSLLNISTLFLPDNDKNCISNLSLFENIDFVKVEELKNINISMNIHENKPIIKDVPIFEGPANYEYNIVKDLSINDSKTIFDPTFFERYLRKEDVCSIYDVKVAVKDIYNFKEDKYRNNMDYPILYDDATLKIDNFKDISICELIVFDKMLKKVIDSFSYFNIVNISEKVNMQKILSKFIIEPNEEMEHIKLQPNYGAAIKFNIFKFNELRFFTKNVLDYVASDIIPFDKFDKEIKNNIDLIHNYTLENKYYVKNIYSNELYQRTNSDIYIKKQLESYYKDLNSSNNDIYSMKAAICYMELVKILASGKKSLLKSGSMT